MLETTPDGERLVSWGLAHLRNRSPRGYRGRFHRLVYRYLPDALVLEDLTGSRRGARVRRVLPVLAAEAERLGIEVRFVSRQAVMEKWGAKNRHEVACLVAERFPELRPWLPEKRRAWEGNPMKVAVIGSASRWGKRDAEASTKVTLSGI